MAMKILLDVMGGDYAPSELVMGAEMARQERSDVEYVLIGDESAIRSVARECGIDLSPYTVVHAESVITMEDNPLCVTREKADSSMSIGLKMLAEGEGHALVSTGNTGALFAGASLIVRKLPGIHRPAIGTVLPLGKPVLLLDSGANILVTPEDLEQFAVMGSAYMHLTYGIEKPRVGLLNNGSEETKGLELQGQTYALLNRCPEICFVGNVEANRVPEGACDVLVTDGFTGNIYLKAIEGMGKMMLGTMKDIFYENVKSKISTLLVRKKLLGVRSNLDPNELGGAPLLGISAPVIKAHGSSKARAYRSAIFSAISYAGSDASRVIAAQMSALHERKKEEKKEKKQAESLEEGEKKSQ
jgi:glycerol-3-phosphate acyltransferase PlsX